MNALMNVPFSKGHGTGNDFVVVPDVDGQLSLTPTLVRALCDRRAGIGADGVLRVVRSAAVDPAEGVDPAAAEWFMDYHNADGSVAQMCGNGVRVYVRYLIETGLVDVGPLGVPERGGEPLRLATRGGVREIGFDATGQVVVEMGAPVHFGASTAVLDGVAYEGRRVSMGNPHLVCVLEDLPDRLDLSRAPAVSTEDFPEGVNVEFVRVIGPGHLRIRVFERGVGETQSCGTGAVAAAAAIRSAAAAAVRSAATHEHPSEPGEYTVDVPGGRLMVTFDNTTSYLAGPAQIVATGTIDENWWRHAAS